MSAAVLSVCASFVAIASDTSVKPMSVQEQAQAKAYLDSLVQLALDNDHGRKQYFAQSQAMRETGVAQSTLMDPKLRVGFGGLPVDSFRFDDDPMTNISVGLMQQFERGSTLDLRHKQANQKADAIGLQVQNRELDVTQSVSQLWLELGYQQYAQHTLKANRALLNELERFIQTNYGLGKSEAQDVLNAQLKISQLDEKLQSNAQMQRRLLSQLSEWLGDDWAIENSELKASNQLAWPILDDYLARHINSSKHYQKLNQHPMVKMVDANIAATETQVELAEQAYTPQFGVEVMYAYRQADNMSGPASDLVSAYLTMDIPLFTDNRQDRDLSAAQYQVGAARSQKDVLLAQLNARVNALIVDRVNLQQRLERYQSTLLSQSQARTQAVERGYQNNTAQYSDVIQASMDELTLQLEYQRLMTDLSVVNSSLAALLGGFEYQVASPQVKIEE
ncbi:TolC family protein [Vibrio sp. WXL210]|uniref:TolC family protein n=1 Tax=Vibrio sp. WXL210 TaxID=3450709 RepID=UPI003EC51746